jgi:hypothetical protein
MGKFGLVFSGVMVSIFVVTHVCAIAFAQGGDPKLDPQQCADLQRQIDGIISIAESTALTNEEKMAQLLKSVTDSLGTMTSAAVKDPEVAKIAQEWAITLTQLLSTAGASSGSGDKSVPPDARLGLDIVKNWIRPYLAMMNLLCPSLVIPETVTR